mmetsp:Transcript_10640/g.20190  ORF Transcript_10640/g.20190 Transcript_10640/m.20190 type:complete len:233 (-) Transcript_10640:166-864(-)
MLSVYLFTVCFVGARFNGLNWTVLPLRDVADVADSVGPSISEKFSVDSFEYDDGPAFGNSRNSTLILSQRLLSDPSSLRFKMTGNGSLVKGYIEQITRCDGVTAPLGYLLNINGPSINSLTCQNLTLRCQVPPQPFWSFPSNASNVGPGVPAFHVRPLPSAPLTKWVFWMDSERWEFYETDKAEPVWFGKVSSPFGSKGWHLFHFEYANFKPVAPPESAFVPSEKVSCKQQQ